MWHGGGLTGVTYESTPDGREGWVNMFIRKGWDTYVSDAVERGRSGFARRTCGRLEPIFLTYQDPFERFRIGDGAGSWNADPAKRKVLPGSQFPVEAYDELHEAVGAALAVDRQRRSSPPISRWSTRSAPACCCCTARAAPFGFLVAEQRPDKIKAIVAVESATAGNRCQCAAS